MMNDDMIWWWIWINESINKWMNEWIDEWINEMNEWWWMNE